MATLFYIQPDFFSSYVPSFNSPPTKYCHIIDDQIQFYSIKLTLAKTQTNAHKKLCRLRLLHTSNNEWTNSFSIMIFIPPHNFTKKILKSASIPHILYYYYPHSHLIISNCVNSSQPAITRPHFCAAAAAQTP